MTSTPSTLYTPATECKVGGKGDIDGVHEQKEIALMLLDIAVISFMDISATPHISRGLIHQCSAIPIRASLFMGYIISSLLSRVRQLHLGSCFLASKVAFSWLSVDRFGKLLGDL